MTALKLIWRYVVSGKTRTQIKRLTSIKKKETGFSHTSVFLISICVFRLDETHIDSVIKEEYEIINYIYVINIFMLDDARFMHVLILVLYNFSLPGIELNFKTVDKLVYLLCGINSFYIPYFTFIIYILNY